MEKIELHIRIDSGKRGDYADEQRALNAAWKELRRIHKALDYYTLTELVTILLEQKETTIISPIWHLVENAADVAYTKGWANPDGTHISVDATINHLYFRGSRCPGVGETFTLGYDECVFTKVSWWNTETGELSAEFEVLDPIDGEWCPTPGTVYWG